MKKIMIMFVMLLGSVTYAQDFDFDCEPTLREIREKIVTDFNAQDGVSNVVITYQNQSYIIVSYTVNDDPIDFFYWSSPFPESNQSVQGSGHFGDQTQTAFDATLTQFKLRLKEANLELALFAFYNGPDEADALDDSDYANQLADVSTILSTKADIAYQGGLETQEAFILSLAQGATFKGSDSYVLWDATGNYHHIVTSNVGEGNGYWDIRLTEGRYLGTTLPALGPENFRHLAYHVMANLWHLADTTDDELRVFRETWLRAYAENRGKWYNSGEYNGFDVYRVSNAHSSDGIDRNCDVYGADRVEDLTLGQFANLIAQWKIDEANL